MRSVLTGAKPIAPETIVTDLWQVDLDVDVLAVDDLVHQPEWRWEGACWGSHLVVCSSAVSVCKTSQHVQDLVRTEANYYGSLIRSSQLPHNPMDRPRILRTVPG